MSLPKWIEDHYADYDHEICGEDCITKQALSIACEFIQQMQGTQFHVPADKAMRRIEELGK